MKIQSITAYGLKGATPKGGWANEIKADECVQTLVVVRTDEGITGTGSVFSQNGLVENALSVMKDLYAGENALEVERVTEKLHQNTFWMGRGGSVTHTISGINLALWDILGKALNISVSRLIGGRYREKVKPYASLLMEKDTSILGHKIEGLKARHYKAFKIGWGPFGRESAALDEKIIKDARKAAGDCDLMVDAGASDAYWKNGYKWAVNTAQMLKDYGVKWFEEAIAPDNLDDFIRLRENSPVAISGGEVLARRQSFYPWILNRAFDIIQPDVTKCGGLSELRRVANLAEDYGVKVIPHGWNTALGLATDLQMAAAFPNTDMIEYLIGSPYVDEIKQGGWAIDKDGFIAIPDSAGLGITLDKEAVEKYTGTKI